MIGERLVAAPHGIELLADFLTVEASQYTASGLVGIKVIEYQNGFHDASSQHQQHSHLIQV